jgi:Flp pilus assembly pilin Flp
VHPIKRAILEIACAVTIAVAGVLGFAGVAGASPSAGTAQSPTSQLICSSAGATGTSSAANDLPATRWAGAISKQHTRLSGGFLGVGDIGQVVQRNVFVGGATAIGASEWKLGIAATELASQFCFANSVGNTADTLAGGLGNAIEGSGIIAALVALAIVAAIWRLSRGQQKQWSKVFRLLAIVGVFVVIVAASTGATGTAPPPRLSPGGIIDTVYGAILELRERPDERRCDGCVQCDRHDA